ncbi:esterase [Bathymodiolus japonicus methanotrophic gill symbiont]|uniref:alpha/beta fold hydrolase n=1 Tax=Bathymodiolus japonicus methanotrophic gill symbiont TaxID=113269 RepID=UPI001B60203D|nr:alpha/beta fold hydrolase [Bathymodiolus japonicus methanotrophic gill symbiont]GFO72337.1 esterase [Bathymodiolus japonicus methanotrophic gill symbiont]
MKAVALAFEEYGDADAPALLISHGFFASSRNWRQIARKLAEHFHIYLLDMRNHGDSPHVSVMDYPSMAADIEFFLDSQELSNANILGHSMGGKAAMWLALSRPEYINKLIVADISPFSYRHSFDNLIQTLKQLPLEELTNRKQADRLLSSAIPESSFRQFLLQNLVLKEGKYSWRIDLDVFAQTADNIIAFPDTDGLNIYLDKVLFLAGEKSNYIDQQSVKKLFPNAVIKTIDGAGHWLHAEQPELFCDAVNEFLHESNHV